MTADRIRLMPIVMTAAAALLALKTVGLVTQTSYLFASPAAAAGAPKAEGHGAAPEAAEHGEAAPPAVRPKEAPTEPATSASEKALLEALQKRRETIEAKASDLDVRENLIKAAERRMEERLVELKRLEEQVSAAEDRRREEDKAKFKELIVLYEGMKVKEAARIFERLDASVLIEVASRMNPRKLAEVMGQMSPDSAERLTVAMARRSDGSLAPRPVAANDLPQIVGRSANP
ncbi:flagellar motility protein MotE (MotC chaperone) [Methylopila capsulata]|uniref:Flagellar motility protein MotE (MotC chaperone) n=1 Tax=Methylopila capsulata TaxID=61654 RepID=A0A9W6MQL9_9HYPH|nr:flagellar protein FlbB [Methylopila capsulata]MBM7851058.1 flagellar motility protein MotE (MotC chaperone) [Methylopila capsulata]GLK54116.1 hypothetical protein GCM10008170_01350 [Methylopila capsulata]